MMANAARQVKLEFPLPPIQHSKNARMHWREQRRWWAAGRDVAIVLIRDQMPGLDADDAVFQTPVRIHIEWRFNRGREPDFDNAVARVAHILDALGHAGVITDDRLVRAMEFDFARVAKDDECLVLTIRPIKRLERTQAGT